MHEGYDEEDFPLGTLRRLVAKRDWRPGLVPRDATRCIGRLTCTNHPLGISVRISLHVLPPSMELSGAQSVTKFIHRRSLRALRWIPLLTSGPRLYMTRCILLIFLHTKTPDRKLKNTKRASCLHGLRYATRDRSQKSHQLAKHTLLFQP